MPSNKKNPQSTEHVNYNINFFVQASFHISRAKNFFFSQKAFRYIDMRVKCIANGGTCYCSMALKIRANFE